MKRAGMVLVALLIASSAGAQQSAGDSAAIDGYGFEHPQRHLIQYVNWVRDYIASEWDLHQGEAVQKERAYCMIFQDSFVWGEYGYLVTAIAPADSVVATAGTSTFSCPERADIVEMHVHPPQTVFPDGTVIPGGPDGYECLWSDNDMNRLVAVKRRFAVIQCDRHALIAHWPGDKL